MAVSLTILRERDVICERLREIFQHEAGVREWNLEKLDKWEKSIFTGKGTRGRF